MAQLELMGMALGVAVAGVAAIFAVVRIFFQPKMDPRVAELAELAFEYAAEVLEVEAKGSPPPVVLRKAPWDKRGTVITLGRYSRRLHLPLIGYAWERIEVVADASYIFRTLSHEMAHALRARAWKKVTEKEAEMVEAKALQYRLTDTQITALLVEF